MTPAADVRREAEALVSRRLGLRLPEERRDDLERAILEGLRSSRLSAEAYLAWLGSLPDGSPEWGRIASRITVGETHFFRDRACFDALEQHVLPTLVAARRREGLLRLRLWSAGCSTGEEPYSLAILLDRLLPDREGWALTILATDVNGAALEAGPRGLYREWSLRGTPDWVRSRYFRPRRAGRLELESGIRTMVTFAPLNLADDGYPSMVTNTSAMDIIVCRNVLMYLGAEAQHASVARLQRALVPGGWLILSPVEASPELMRPLVPVEFPGAIFHCKEQPLSAPPPRARQPPEPPPLPFFPPAPAPEAPPEPPADTPLPDGALLERARALADRGQLEQARALCKAAVAEERLDPQGHFLLAAICQELGDIPAALEGLRRSIYLAPDSAPAHFLLGTLLLRAGERPRGRRCLESAVRLLESLPGDRTLDGAGGLTAGRLRQTAQAYLAKG